MKDIVRNCKEDRVRRRYANIIDRMQARLDELESRDVELTEEEAIERESLSDRIESAEARMESAVERELTRVDSMIDGMDQESLERQVDRVFNRENSGPLGKLLIKHPNEARYDDVSKRLETIESERRETNRRRQSIGRSLRIQRSGIGQTVFAVVKARPVKYFK